MNDQRIAIVTDSGTDVPADFASEHEIFVVPLQINYSDGTTYRSGIDISEEEVVRRFAQEIPTTSLPTPEAIKAHFELAKASGYERAVFVSISSALSATNQTAHIVAEQMEDFPVIVVDTKSIGLGAGLLVMSAVRMVEAGVPFEELEERFNALVPKSNVYFTTKTLTYLRKGGRINEATYRLGSVLNIKPVITCDAGGYYVTAKKARGWERAIDAEINLIRARAAVLGDVIIGIACSASMEMFDALEERLRASISGIREVIRGGFSPTLLVHTGPDVVGITISPALDL